MMVFPTWLRVALAVAIAAIDYSQTQHVFALSPEAQFAVGLASAIAGALLAFQNATTRLVRKVTGRQ